MRTRRTLATIEGRAGPAPLDRLQVALVPLLGAPLSTLTIPGPPRTKKNSADVQWRTGKTRKRKSVPIASAAWRSWRDDALRWFRETYGMGARLEPYGWPVTVPVVAVYAIHRDAARGDLSGYLQGADDLLQELGIIANDALVRAYDGSRLYVDHAAPRLVVTLYPYLDLTELP